MISPDGWCIPKVEAGATSLLSHPAHISPQSSGKLAVISTRQKSDAARLAFNVAPLTV